MGKVLMFPLDNLELASGAEAKIFERKKGAPACSKCWHLYIWKSIPKPKRWQIVN